MLRILHTIFPAIGVLVWGTGPTHIIYLEADFKLKEKFECLIFIDAYMTPPPRIYCFTAATTSITTITTAYLLFYCHHHRHHHIFIVSLRPPPPQFCCFPSATTTIFLFSHCHHHHYTSITEDKILK